MRIIMKEYKYGIVLFWASVVFLYAQDYNLEKRCGMPGEPSDVVLQSKEDVDIWLNARNNREAATHVYVAFHVIHSSSNTGNITTATIEGAMDKLNLRYNEHNIHFTLDTINRISNDTWFTLPEDELWGDVEEEFRQSTAIDPVHYYNIWSCNMANTDAAGWNYFPNWSSEDSHWQGTTIDYRYVGFANETLPHEAGHYFYLYHTFQGGCSEPGDAVDDTPFQDDNDSYPCVESTDSCPNQAGNDPVHNIMNYSSDNCRDRFSAGQKDRMHASIAQYHPGLLENNFFYPNLEVNQLYVLADSDGDGNFNPGETTRAKISVANTWGGDAVNVIATLSCDDPRITILDNTIEFSNSIAPGNSAFTFDYFLLTADTNALTGSIPANVFITAGEDDYLYEINEQITFDLTLSQTGFPYSSSNVKSSPLVVDSDGDGIKEIYFGGFDSNFHGINPDGELLPGFPIETGNNILSSAASADLDLDGDTEIVFGSKDQNLYIINSNGSQQTVYSQTGYILGSPVLSDLDGDQDIEVIFGTQDGSGGQVFAIHHDGSEVAGFPVNIQERILVGAAVHDLENDGIKDIVLVTWSNNIWVIDASGNIKAGFPFETTKRFNAAPTIADVDNDQDYEIIAGNDGGDLFILNHDGSIYSQFSTGDDIRSGIALGDIDQNGSVELIIVGYDDYMHVWNPITNSELDGWPVDLGHNSVSAPVLADIDNDGILDIITASKDGKIHAFNSNGLLVNNFPVSTGLSIDSPPAVSDIDNDGDYELLIGTSGGLEVIDIKSVAGNLSSWKMHRGNHRRTGVYNAQSLMNAVNEGWTGPGSFAVSHNFPNPFNPTTTFQVNLENQGDLDIAIYDVSGRLVKRLMNQNSDAGLHTFRWNGRNDLGYILPTGIYFLRVLFDGSRHFQKMAFVK